MNIKWMIPIVGAIFAAANPAASAVIGGIVNGGTGNFVEITDTTGLSVGDDVQQNNNTVFAFNEDGTVADVLEFDLEDGQQVAINDRVTRTRGKELSFLEQLIGGVGKGAGAVDPDNAPQ